MAPSRAKKTRPITVTAAEKRRSRKRARSSAGRALRRSQRVNRARTARPPSTGPQTVASAQSSDSPPRITPYTRMARPATERATPSGSKPVRSGSRDSGTTNSAATAPITTMGRLIRNTEPHQNRSSSAPPHDGAQRDGESGGARPDTDGLGAFGGREDGHDDREGGGQHQGAADAQPGPGDDQFVGAVGVGRPHGTAAEDDEPGQQRAFASAAVGEHAGGEEQGGEDEGVGVDRPLQLALRGPEADGCRLRRASSGPRSGSTCPGRRGGGSPAGPRGRATGAGGRAAGSARRA